MGHQVRVNHGAPEDTCICYPPFSQLADQYLTFERSSIRGTLEDDQEKGQDEEDGNVVVRAELHCQKIGKDSYVNNTGA